jgi:hypothetical protein
MKYKIKNFDVENAQLLIEFNNLITYSFDLPIDDEGNIPIKEDLHKYIKNLIPIWHFQRLEKLKKGLKTEQIKYIKSLINKEIITDE